MRTDRNKILKEWAVKDTIQPTVKNQGQEV